MVGGLPQEDKWAIERKTNRTDADAMEFLATSATETFSVSFFASIRRCYKVSRHRLSDFVELAAGVHVMKYVKESELTCKTVVRETLEACPIRCLRQR